MGLPAQNMGLLRGAMSTLPWKFARRQSTSRLDPPNMMSDSPNARISIHPYHPILLIQHSKFSGVWTVTGRLRQSDCRRPARPTGFTLVFFFLFFFFHLSLIIILLPLRFRLCHSFSTAFRDTSGSPDHWMGRLAIIVRLLGCVYIVSFRRYLIGKRWWEASRGDMAHWATRYQQVRYSAPQTVAIPPAGPHVLSWLGFRMDQVERCMWPCLSSCFPTKQLFPLQHLTKMRGRLSTSSKKLED